MTNLHAADYIHQTIKKTKVSVLVFCDICEDLNSFTLFALIVDG